jgi:hypothetical protein
MQKLIIINGTMGIGKTTVAKLVFTQLPCSAYLDGDEVWHINPFVVTDATKALVERNITSVLRGYLDAGYEHVILSWVMYRQEIIDVIVKPLADLQPHVSVFTLVADEATAVQRVLERDGPARDPEGVLMRLRESLKLDSTKIDTTHRTADEAASMIIRFIQHH